MLPALTALGIADPKALVAKFIGRGVNRSFDLPSVLSWRELHPEEYREANAKWHREWARKHPTKARMINREKARRWRERHPQIHRERVAAAMQKLRALRKAL